MSPALAGKIFIAESPGKPKRIMTEANDLSSSWFPVDCGNGHLGLPPSGWGKLRGHSLKFIIRSLLMQNEAAIHWLLSCSDKFSQFIVNLYAYLSFTSVSGYLKSLM